MRIVVSLGSLLFPGFGHAVLSRRKTALVWSLGLIAVMWLGTWFPYAMLFGMLLRIPCALHTFVSMKFAGARVVESAPPTAVVAGNVAEQAPPKRNWRFAAIIAVITACGFGLQRRFTEGFTLRESAMIPTLLAGDRVLTESLTLLWRGPERGEVVVFEYPCDPQRKFISRVIAVGGDTVEVRCDRVYVNGAAVPTVPQTGECSFLEGDIGYSTRETTTCSRFMETIGDHTFYVVTDPESPGATVTDDVHDFPFDDLPRCENALLSTVADAQPGTLVTTKRPERECEPWQHYVVPSDHVFVLGDQRDNANDSRRFGAVPKGRVKGIATYVWMSMAPEGRSRRFIRVNN